MKPTAEERSYAPFTPRKTGHERTNYFTRGLDGWDEGNQDLAYEEYKKKAYGNSLVDQIADERDRKARSAERKRIEDEQDTARMNDEIERQHQRHLAEVEESKKYLDKDGKPAEEGKGGNKLGGKENPEEDYGWWYGMDKE